MKRASSAIAVVFFCSFLPSVRGETGRAADARDGETKRLIRDLGAKQFAVREAATRKLMERDEALPAVREAARSTDAEVARRAREVLKHLEARAQARRLRQILELGEQGQLDRMIDGLLEFPCPADDADYWSGALRTIWGVADRVRQKGAPNHKDLPFYKGTCDDFVRGWRSAAKYYKFDVAPEPDTGHHGLIRTHGWQWQRNPFGLSVILSDGPVECLEGIHASILLVNGQLRIRVNVHGSLIVCDREPELEGVVTDSLILLRGPVTKRVVPLVNAVLVSPGKLELSPKAINCTAVDSRSLPQNVLHWFEPADVGLEVDAAKEGVTVSKVATGMPPEKAGIQKGDLITAVDGKKVDSEDTFRILLRRGSVRPSCHLTIRRGDKTLEPLVDFWETLPKK